MVVRAGDSPACVPGTPLPWSHSRSSNAFMSTGNAAGAACFCHKEMQAASMAIQEMTHCVYLHSSLSPDQKHALEAIILPASTYHIGPHERGPGTRVKCSICKYNIKSLWCCKDPAHAAKYCPIVADWGLFQARVHLEALAWVSKLTTWKKQRPQMTLWSVLSNPGKNAVWSAMYEARGTQKLQADKAHFIPQKKNRLLQPDSKHGSPGRCPEAGLCSEQWLWLTTVSKC